MRSEPDILVVGGGPAGLAAALSAARTGASVLLLERQPEAGAKLLITGAGKCNLTHGGDMDLFYEAYFGNGRFLRPAFRFLSNDDLLLFFRQRNLHTYETPDGKLFPVSGKAADVRDELVFSCLESGVRIQYGERVTGVDRIDGTGAFRVRTDRNPEGWTAPAVVLATGGLSYPSTGSTGDGLRFARQLGIPAVPTRPGLAPLTCSDPWCGTLAGISANPVHATLVENRTDGSQKRIGQEDGSLLFTHSGVSGPVILRLSRALPDGWETNTYSLLLDFFPGENRDELVARIADRLESEPKKQTANALAGLLPAALLKQVMDLSGIDPLLPAGAMPVKAKNRLVDNLKRLRLTVGRPASYAQAMVTAGGISLRSIDPRTMAVRSVPGLFIAGEVADLDGDTGGYNLQAAFSTGALAGCRAAESLSGAGTPAVSFLDLFR